MLENSTGDGAAGGETGNYPPPAEPHQQHQHQYLRHRGPFPYATRFQTREQRPHAGPWPKRGDSDANGDRSERGSARPFRCRNHENAPSSASRSSTFPTRPAVLELRTDGHVPPDLISPRSDSFFYTSQRARPPPSPSPSVQDFQSSASRTRAESSPNPMLSTRQPRSAFPGLSSNPFIPEDGEPEPSRSEVRKFPLLARQHEEIDPSSPIPTLNSPVESRTVTPTEGNMVVENFSRPRKTSVKSQQSDGALSRHATAQRLQPDATLDQPAHSPPPPTPSSTNPHPWPRVRRLSGSSSWSASTFSSIPPRPSHDQLNAASANNSLRQPNPHAAGGTGPFARPPLAFHSHANGSPANTREPPPWLASGDEFRSSFRSQLTASTAQGTTFTPVETERNSILTKASSITEQSVINGYSRASWRPDSVDDGPSVEDVMGMYERGFNDSDVESMRRSVKLPDGDDLPEVDLDAGPPEMDSSRPGSSQSNASELREKMLEAMSDSLPIPGAVPIPGSERTSARESLNRSRHPLLPNSLPSDVGMGHAAASSMRRRDSTDPDVMEKHDSAKLLNDGEGEDDKSEILRDQSTAPTSPTSPVQAEPPAANSPSSPPAITPAAPPRVPQEPPEEPDSRDRYGFRKAGANITRQEYDAWNAGYTEYLARRRKKWIAFLKDNSLMTDRPNRFPPRSNKTKRFIRKGIPPDWRGAAWFYYAGGPAILSKHKGVYELLVKRAGLDPNGPGKLPDRKGEVKPVIVDDIEKDLYRTFPDNVRFKPPPPPPGSPAASEPPPEPTIITSLRRVLHAFAIYNPRIGYCQSLNFLAGLLLLFVETEEHAFWLLNIITRVYLPGTHEMSLEGSKVDLGVLMLALKDSMPGVWKQIGGDEFEAGKKSRGKRAKDGRMRGHAVSGSINDPNRLPAITLCMTAWFMSCFIGTLPIETVLRVWDVFFYEGSRTLFRIALTIFKLGEREIKAVQDPMEMFGVVQTFPRRIIDCNMLLETCYKRRNGIGHISQQSVEVKRQERRDGIRKWKAEQEAAAAAAAAAAAGASDTGHHNSQRPATTATAASGGKHRFGVSALGLDLAGDLDEVRRKGNLFSRRKGAGDAAG